MLAAVAVFLLALTGVAQAAFPGRSGRIAFVHWSSLGMLIETVRPDGTGRLRISPCEPGRCAYASPAFSPDGMRIAYGPPVIPWEPGNPRGLVIASGDGSDARELPVQSENNDGEPAWAPDGRSLAFTGSSGSLPDTRIYSMDLAGNGLTPITSGRADRDAAWSSRGSLAVVRHPTGSRHVNLYTLRPDGSGLRQLTFRGGGEPSWSPRGSKLAFERYARNRRSRGTNAFIISAGGRGLRQLTFKGGTDPTWSPDGKRIAFIRGGDLYTVRADGRGLRRVARAPGRENLLAEPDWQPLR
jgi:TolB protein